MLAGIKDRVRGQASNRKMTRANCLESEAAREFVAQMPTPQQLMPAITVAEIEAAR